MSLNKASTRRIPYGTAIVGALIVFLANAWRLGAHAGGLAIVAIFGLCFANLCIFPVVRLAKASPKPKRSAFLFWGTWIAAYGYVIASYFFPTSLPAPLFVMLVGVVLMWAFFIKYRQILYPSLFNRKT